MNTVECPLCEADAAIDAALTLVSCDRCGSVVEIAPDAVSPTDLDLAA
jgi:ribosomal protein S27E